MDRTINWTESPSLFRITEIRNSIVTIFSFLDVGKRKGKEGKDW